MVCSANLLCNAVEPEHAFKYLLLLEEFCHLGPNVQFLAVCCQNLLMKIYITGKYYSSYQSILRVHGV